MDLSLDKVKNCKSCHTQLSEDNAFTYEIRGGKALLRNRCKKCYIARKKQVSGTSKVNSKVCPRCKTSKPACEFGIDRIRKDGIGYLCKSCARISNYRTRIKAKYSLTLERYEALKTDQNNKCACCLKISKLVVDHNHANGKVRGLLCDKCNMALGLIGDSISTLRRMEEYLEGGK